MDERIALGMIETKGLVGLIEASDAAVKAAKVIAVNYERTGGGLCIIKVRGTVGAVKAAVEAGAQAAMKIGELISAHVIPNPAGNVEPMITPEEPPKTQKPAREFHRWRTSEHKGDLTMTVRFDPEDERLVEILEKYKKSGIEALDYNELRYLARRVQNFPMMKSKIRNAGRRQLLNAFRQGEIKVIE